jgi:hypothetical protein
MTTNPCEWDPERDKPSEGDGCRQEATVCVGANGKCHLCEMCAELPRFKRMKKQKLKGEPT